VVGVVFGGLAFSADAKANRLAEGCHRELYEQGKKDAAALANTGAAAGPSGHGPSNIRNMTCEEVRIRTPTSGVSADPNGDPVITGGRILLFCTPIVLDLDGDGIEYRSMNNFITTDEDGDDRFEQRAWVSSDDGVLFWDVNNDGLGDHEETVLTGYVEGSQDRPRRP
jgi:hypothetical protein